jgi:hypothetical protein
MTWGANLDRARPIPNMDDDSVDRPLHTRIRWANVAKAAAVVAVVALIVAWPKLRRSEPSLPPAEGKPLAEQPVVPPPTPAKPATTDQAPNHPHRRTHQRSRAKRRRQGHLHHHRDHATARAKQRRSGTPATAGARRRAPAAGSSVGVAASGGGANGGGASGGVSRRGVSGAGGSTGGVSHGGGSSGGASSGGGPNGGSKGGASSGGASGGGGSGRGPSSRGGSGRRGSGGDGPSRDGSAAGASQPPEFSIG